MTHINTKHRKTLEAIFSDPANGNLDWAKIEALFRSLGCEVFEKRGAAVAFCKGGVSVHFHRPHPSSEALRYRVLAAREFLAAIGVRP
jgi:hypothetical protein